MINRFKNKLRLSGIEDQLQRDLEIPRTASAWLSRLAFDLAQKNGHNLLAIERKFNCLRHRTSPVDLSIT